jgi:hypothetical protein
MATIDLGKIKIVWRGTYAGGTAYTPDDAVVSSGTSYICIANTTGNAPPNGTYWNVLAQGGTDISTTLTTQGDILYRNGSGLARLAAGTNGQALLTGGSGANPSWGSAGGGKINQVLQVVTNTEIDLNSSSSFVDVTGLSLAITPSATTSKILIMADINFDLTANDRGFQIRILRDSTTVFAEANNKSTYENNSRVAGRNPYFELDAPSSTSSLTYKIQQQNDSGGPVRFNQGGGRSSMVLMEVLA